MPSSSNGNYGRTQLLVRDLQGDMQTIEISERTTMGEVIDKMAPSHGEIVVVERDYLHRVKAIRPAIRSESALSIHRLANKVVIPFGQAALRKDDQMTLKEKLFGRSQSQGKKNVKKTKPKTKKRSLQHQSVEESESESDVEEEEEDPSESETEASDADDSSSEEDSDSDKDTRKNDKQRKAIKSQKSKKTKKKTVKKRKPVQKEETSDSEEEEEENDDGDYTSNNIPSKDLFHQCNLWMATEDDRHRIYFNAYTRMALGLPMWYLDIFVSRKLTVEHLSKTLFQALRLNGEDEQHFALYGYTGGKRVTHLGGHESLLGQSSKDGYFQLMRLPETEAPHHLGVIREGYLHLKTWPIPLVKGPRYYFTLQGNSLFYQPSKKDRTWQKAITLLHQCTFDLRYNHQRTEATLLIHHPTGSKYQLSGVAPKKLSRWMKSMRRCHPSEEINKPIDEAMIEDLLRPSPPPVVWGEASSENTQRVNRGGKKKSKAPNKDREDKAQGELPPPADEQDVFATLERYALKMALNRSVPVTRMQQWMEHLKAEIIVPTIEEGIDEIIVSSQLRPIFVHCQTIVRSCQDLLELRNGKDINITSRIGDILEIILCHTRDLQEATFKKASSSQKTGLKSDEVAFLKKLLKAMRQPIHKIDLNKVSSYQPDYFDEDIAKAQKVASLTEFVNERMAAKRNMKLSQSELEDLSATEPESNIDAEEVEALPRAQTKTHEQASVSAFKKSLRNKPSISFNSNDVDDQGVEGDKLVRGRSRTLKPTLLRDHHLSDDLAAEEHDSGVEATLEQSNPTKSLDQLTSQFKSTSLRPASSQTEEKLEEPLSWKKNTPSDIKGIVIGAKNKSSLPSNLLDSESDSDSFSRPLRPATNTVSVPSKLAATNEDTTALDQREDSIPSPRLQPRRQERNERARSRSRVVIDDTLLQALLKDPKLSKFVHTSD